MLFVFSSWNLVWISAPGRVPYLYYSYIEYMENKIHINFHEDKEAVLFTKSCLILNSLIETEVHLKSYWKYFSVFESFQEFILVFSIQRRVFLVLNLIESVFTYLNHSKVHSIFLIQRKIFLVLKRCSSYCLHRFSLNHHTRKGALPVLQLHWIHGKQNPYKIPWR